MSATETGTTRRALLSVYDKTGIVEFAHAAINQRGNQVVSGVAINMLAAGLAVQLHFIDVDVEERWRRVENRNAEKGETFRLAVTRPMFDFIETIWQPPDADEMAALNGRRVAA